jgi:DHA1 family bicyclomycin/chloramphenicol resistance-like MFS transporter
MMSVNLFATDIYLPALPEMAITFGCSQSEIQFSFTIFLVGLAVCQLITGGLTDRFGRKTVALIGFSIFTVCSLLCADASSLTELNVYRLMQAIGGGVGSVIGRALVADHYNRRESVKIFSTVYPIVGLSAALGPLIGGYVTAWWDWRANFVLIAFFGLLILLLAGFCLKDKVKSESIESNTMIERPYVNVMRNLEFLGYAFIICASFCVFRSYSIESPFVFHKQGYYPEEMGNFYISLSLAYLAGNLAAKKLINTMDVSKVLKIGFFFLVLGGVSMVASTFLVDNNIYTIVIPMTIITLGNGFLFPVASAAAMTSVRGELTGTASGIMGAMQFLLAAFCTIWIGDICQGDALLLSLFMGGVILLGVFSYFLLVYGNIEVVTDSGE